jgi:hypothetical protein
MGAGWRFACQVVAFALLSAVARAEPLVVQPRLSAGTQQYQLSFADVITPNGNSFRFRNGFTVGDRLAFGGAGITLSSGSLFADLSGQWSRTGTDQGEIFQGTAFDANGDTTGALGHEHHFDARFARHEINAALGWAVNSDFSAYLGYKDARLSMTQARAPVLPVPEFGDVLQLGTFTMDFSYHGFFLGGTYSIPVAPWDGAFSIQSSIARLSASFTQYFAGSVAIYTAAGLLFLDPAFMNSHVTGTSTGLNLGLSWTGNLAWMSARLRNLSYTLGVDESQYKFDAPSVVDGNFEEKNTRMRLDLRYRFGA